MHLRISFQWFWKYLFLVTLLLLLYLLLLFCYTRVEGFLVLTLYTLIVVNSIFLSFFFLLNFFAVCEVICRFSHVVYFRLTDSLVLQSH